MRTRRADQRLTHAQSAASVFVIILIPAEQRIAVAAIELLRPHVVGADLEVDGDGAEALRPALDGAQQRPADAGPLGGYRDDEIVQPDPARAAAHRGWRARSLTSSDAWLNGSCEYRPCGLE